MPKTRKKKQNKTENSSLHVTCDGNSRTQNIQIQN